MSAEVISHTVAVHSFGTKNPKPPIIRFRIGVDNLRDPYGQPSLRLLNGRHKEVQEFLAIDPRVKVIIDEMCALTYSYIVQGRDQYVSIGIHDRHGMHISPALVEMLAAALRQDGFTVIVHHHELPPRP